MPGWVAASALLAWPLVAREVLPLRAGPEEATPARVEPQAEEPALSAAMRQWADSAAGLRSAAAKDVSAGKPELPP